MKSFWRISSLSVGSWSVIAGAWGAAECSDEAIRAGIGPAWPGFLLLGVVFALMICGGIMVLRKKPAAAWLVLVGQMLQLPIMSSESFRYAIQPAPALEWMLFPDFGISWSTASKYVVKWGATG